MKQATPTFSMGTPPGRSPVTGMRGLLRKSVGFIVWGGLIAAGALMGLAAVSSITNRDVPIPDSVAANVIEAEDIQSSTPLSVKPPAEDVLNSLIPLPLSGGKAIQVKKGISLQPIETRCGVERILEWSRPGGQYCAITMVVMGRGRGDVVMKASDQAIYPIDSSLEGYRGSFFLNPERMPVREILIKESDNYRAVLVVDSPVGFVPAVALLQESALMPTSVQGNPQADTQP